MFSSAPMVDIHTHKPAHDSRFILAYSIGIDSPPAQGVPFSAGIHPWSARKVDTREALEYLETASAIAIGEIGLDYIKGQDRGAQKQIFEAQLDIALRRELPVIIHCVKAYNDVLAILNSYGGLKAAVFHGYIGSPEQTKTIIDCGYYISLNKTSLASPKTVRSVQSTPDSRIFAETDSGDYSVKEVYGELSNILKIPERELAAIIWNNYKTVFE